ncbi:MAG TPA: hypothetical protein VGG54_22595 [Trebonia sp.]
MTAVLAGSRRPVAPTDAEVCRKRDRLAALGLPELPLELLRAAMSIPPPGPELAAQLRGWLPPAPAPARLTA